MNTSSVLVVDDDVSVRRTICRILESDGLETEQAVNGEHALGQIGQYRYDLVILDLMLGDTSGFEIIKAVRERDESIPIIVLSARVQDNDKVLALAIGADDYLTKPFSPYYLCAKVKATLRRCGNVRSDEILLPPFRYNAKELRLYKDGNEVHLTAHENKMILHFLTHPGKICSKDELYRCVWGNDIVDNNTIMVCISNLRKKIEEVPERPSFIQTVRGLGYRFCGKAQ